VIGLRTLSTVASAPLVEFLNRSSTAHYEQVASCTICGSQWGAWQTQRKSSDWRRPRVDLPLTKNSIIRAAFSLDEGAGIRAITPHPVLHAVMLACRQRELHQTLEPVDYGACEIVILQELEDGNFGNGQLRIEAAEAPN
jgi:hypothetical protein